MSSGIEVWKIDSKTPKAEIENVLRQWDEANRASIQNALIVPKDGKPSQIERVITSSMTGLSATVISSIANNRLIDSLVSFKDMQKMVNGLAEFNQNEDIDWGRISDSLDYYAVLKKPFYGHDENAKTFTRILGKSGFFENIKIADKKELEKARQIQAYDFANGIKMIDEQRQAFYKSNAQVLNKYKLTIKPVAMTLSTDVYVAPKLDTASMALNKGVASRPTSRPGLPAIPYKVTSGIKKQYQAITNEANQRVTQTFRPPVIAE